MRFGGRRPPASPDPDLIRALARLLAENDLTEIEYAVGDRRVRVTRSPAATTASAGSVAPTGTGAPSDWPGTIAGHPGAVTAPMVGTAYLALQPGVPALVRLGETVAEGQPLLIIEAMKVMNEIRAPRAGRIAQILVADAQPVEYGAILMVIE
ncbi:MAG: acetyl-CoA carboxylase biotin carboxyl carrier protein subunit [Stellaceae bacterium]